MVVQRIGFRVLEELLPVFFLQSEADPNNTDPSACPALAGGKERACEAWARRLESKGDTLGANRLRMRGQQWRAAGDAAWDRLAAALVAGLPRIDTYIVLPSSRGSRRDPLLAAMRARHGDAVEVTCSRPAGMQFMESDETTIFDSIVLSRSVDVAACGLVAVVDDFLGNGNTLRAVARRARLDLGAETRLIAAFPGINGRGEAYGPLTADEPLPE